MLQHAMLIRRISVVVGILAMCWAAARPVAAQQIDPTSPIADALTKAQQAVDRIIAIPDSQRTFENTVVAIDDLLAQLDKDTSFIQFMAYVSTDPDERARGALAEEHFNNWLIELGKNEKLYEAVKTVAASKVQLHGERARLLEHTLRDYRRAGMELSPDKRRELTQLQMEISRLGIEFSKNIREDETTVLLTREELVGVPDDVLQRMQRSRTLYVVTMDYPTYNAVMTYCESEPTRQKVWTAYRRRGGEKNVGVLERMIKARAQAAKLLGYQHTADYEIEVRMAKNAQTVHEFYNKLRPLVREKARQDFAEFTEAKRAHTGDPHAVFQPWDYAFYENVLRKTKYSVDAKQVQEYFPIERVIEGLFSITQSLYGLEYRDITQEVRNGRTTHWPLWHDDVKLYEVWDKATGRMLGEFYLDLHPRANKYSHAAQWGLVQHKRWSDGRVETPIAALVCNFTKPTEDRPSLLTHDEVETFFHEFGHCLHTILSEAEFARFAGTNTERDFVEAPSQMFENWVWDADVLRTFARHYQTGEPIPQELVEGMIRARHLGSGLFAERQFAYGMLDLAYHTAADGDVDTTSVQYEIFDEAELFDAVPGTWFQAGFGHLNGYQAGYYGYQWSLVYAQDMFQRFKELGMLNPEAGMYYRKKILARGGTMDGLDMVRDYLGREPQMDAYLRHLGLQLDESGAGKKAASAASGQ